jgi:hypothetical protein
LEEVEAVKAIQWERCTRLEHPDICTPHRSPCTKLGTPDLLEAVFLDPRISLNIESVRKTINWGNADEVLGVGLG